METIKIVGVKAEIARTFAERAKGLIGRRGLVPGTGMLITHCNAVHTFFMRFPIDVTFLDGAGTPVKIVRHVKPWRFLVWGGWKAKMALETESK